MIVQKSRHPWYFVLEKAKGFILRESIDSRKAAKRCVHYLSNYWSNVGVSNIAEVVVYAHVLAL